MSLSAELAIRALLRAVCEGVHAVICLEAAQLIVYSYQQVAASGIPLHHH